MSTLVNAGFFSPKKKIRYQFLVCQLGVGLFSDSIELGLHNVQNDETIQVFYRKNVCFLIKQQSGKPSNERKFSISGLFVTM